MRLVLLKQLLKLVFSDLETVKIFGFIAGQETTFSACIFVNESADSLYFLVNFGQMRADLCLNPLEAINFELSGCKDLGREPGTKFAHLSSEATRFS